MKRSAIVSLAAVSVAASCTIDRSDFVRECPPGWEAVGKRCVQPEEGGAGGAGESSIGGANHGGGAESGRAGAEPKGGTVGGPFSGGAAGAPREGNAGDGGAEPACVPSTEVCNGVDDDCDGQIDTEDAGSNVEFGFSEFVDVGADTTVGALMDAVWAEEAQVYGLLWTPFSWSQGVPGSTLEAPRLYRLDSTGQLQGTALELADVAASAYRGVRVATSGFEFAVAWSQAESAGSSDVSAIRMQRVDAATGNIIGNTINVADDGLTGVWSALSVVWGGTDWYVAYARQSNEPDHGPIRLARIGEDGSVGQFRVLEADRWDSEPQLATAGDAIGLTWVRDSDQNGVYDEAWFSRGTDLAELTEVSEFERLGVFTPDSSGGASDNVYHIAATSTHFMLAPHLPSLPFVRFTAGGTEECNEVWSSSAFVRLRQVASLPTGSIATGKLTDAGGYGAVQIANDCQSGESVVVVEDSSSSTVGFRVAVAASDEGALLLKNEYKNETVTRAVDAAYTSLYHCVAE